MEGIVSVYGVIGGMPNEKGEIIKPCVTFVDVARQVESQKEATNFSMVVNSPGGYVEDGDEIYNYLESIQKSGRPITTYAEGECASMATKLFLVGERRIIRPGTVFMIHNPSGAPKDGDADYIESYSKALRSLESDMINFYHKRTGTSKEALRALMKKETVLTPEEAVEFGFATEIQERIETKAVAFSKKFNQNKLKMADQKKNEELESNLNTILAKVAAFFSKDEKPKAKLVQDASGTEIDFYELEEDATPSVGDKARVDGNAASGEHTMPSGQVYVFEAGELTAIREADSGDEDVEALKKERDELKEKLDAQNKKAEETEKEIKALKDRIQDKDTEMKDIQKDIKALKSSIGSSFSHDPKKKNYQEPKDGTRSLFKKD